MYGALQVGKPGAIRSGERPIVCSMADETKRKNKIILENSWVYLKGTKCSVCEDRTYMQQEACRKPYENQNKSRKKPPQNKEQVYDEENASNK